MRPVLWRESAGLPSDMAAGFPQRRRPEREPLGWEPQSSNDLISEVTSYDFCHIQLIRSELPNTAHPGKGDYGKALRKSWDRSSDLKTLPFSNCDTIWYYIMMF